MPRCMQWLTSFVQYRDTSLAYWWPLKQLADSDQEDPSQDLAQQTAGWADPKETSNPRHGHSTHKAPLQQCSSRAKQQCRQNAQPLTAQRPVRRSVPMARGRGSSDSGPDSNTDDSIHTAHFSDEGELSEADTGTTAEQQQKHRGTKQGPVVLYHGPNSQQLAAIRASSRPPPGPRPQLGDALLEAIHSDDVKMSAKATGVLEEPISRDKWQCIMRRRCADGCGPHSLTTHQSCPSVSVWKLWTSRQC